jgi:hypothetical protein
MSDWKYTGVISLQNKPRSAGKTRPKYYPGSTVPLPDGERIPGFPHHPAELQALCGTQTGKKMLIILGGPSGARWSRIADTVKPDLVMGVNGVIRAMRGDLDYWLCMESWKRESPPVWFQDACRGLRIVSWKRYKYLENTQNALSARRGGPFFNTGIEAWNPRIYGGGLYMHERFSRPELFDSTWSTSVLGTIAMQALHLSCMLGCSEIYTIGLDLHIPSENEHWYQELPISRSNEWWDERMFTQHGGLSTMWWWIDSATLLLEARKVLSANGCTWWDESDGLLSRMGMPCRQ